MQGEVRVLSVIFNTTFLFHRRQPVLDFFFLRVFLALAGVAQWIEHQPANRRVAGSIPSQGTSLGCGPGPQLRACEKQLIHVSLPLFLLPFPSL